MNPNMRHAQILTRRHFLRNCQVGLGGLALGSLLAEDGHGAGSSPEVAPGPMAPRQPHFEPKAKHVIYLHMAGSPPQHDMFDYKPKLNELHMQNCPQELLEGQRFAFIKGTPKILGSPHKFDQHGQSGAWVSELLPHIAGLADDICFIKSMVTDQFNHAPAQLLLYTGSNLFGRASMGSWITYGLGSENQNLPGFVVLGSGGTDPSGGKALWGSAYLPSIYQGVQCRSQGDPILYINDPPGMSRDVRRRSLDALRQMNEYELETVGDPETLTRIEQYELAYRMQETVPEVMDISRETQETIDMYGAQPGGGGFANNCLLARRLVESGVRYVQLFDWGWDMHGTDNSTDLITALPNKCRQTDRPIAALISDLKQRGLLDETLIVWGGEFGRTSMNEERNGSKLLGRDHHPHCFTMWMAGGGIKGGYQHGQTDEFGYFVAENPTPIHDLHATILHQLGIDAHRLGLHDQGLFQRLIGPTTAPRVLDEILA